ncbi:MAG: ComEC/Rec2 family competence protein, partial [Ureaplasma sp.]|nr:ComEC/Rec2 family competence protein [Ureaplasma sp.]
LILLSILILTITNTKKYCFHLKIIFLFLLLVYILFVLTIKYIAIDTKFLKTLITNKFPNFWSIRYKAINYINLIYKNKSVADFIYLILFNYKNSYSNEIYQKLIQLSIVHLFIISGLHVNFFFALIKKIFFKEKKYFWINNSINLIICLVYSYFLNFSISIIRITINCFIKFINKNLNWIKINNISGILILIIFPKESTNFGFLMSYLCVITIGLVSNNNLNKILQLIIVNFFCILVTLPIIIKLNGKINIFAIFLSIIYTPITFFSYFWYLFFAWWTPFIQINTEIFKIISLLINWTIRITFQVQIKKIHSFFIVLYYSLSYFLIFSWWKIQKNMRLSVF